MYLRLLAGLTSFISNLWRSHFAAIGPVGIFASSVIVLRPRPAKYAQTAMTMKPPAMSDREEFPGGQHARRPSRVVEAERLERARDAMPEMRADDDHAEDVEADHERVGEVFHLEAIEIAAARRPSYSLPNRNALTWMMMKDQQPQAGNDHRRGGEASCGWAGRRTSS